ncbi:MAG: orotidine-5'-phosphate decarboxylase [Alphaproteobacteria bacterium]
MADANPTRPRLFCALDTPSRDKALALARPLIGAVDGFKLGLEFFAAAGPDGVRAVGALGKPIFLDLKFHDIPNTVAGAVRSTLPLAPAYLTLHAAGGVTMMQAAVEAAAEADRLGVARPRLLAVTVLTSLDAGDLAAQAVQATPEEQVARLATLAQRAGIDGAVCSPKEIAPLRRVLGPGLALVVPGIRPAWAATDDQKRVMTPAEAAAAGADLLVIGRPITAAADPAEAARRIRAEMTA